MLKLGYRGLYLRTAKIDRLNRLGRAAPSNLAAWEDLMIYQPSYKVSVAGTTGAGDACIAGLLAAFLRDTSPDDAVKPQTEQVHVVAKTGCVQRNTKLGTNV